MGTDIEKAEPMQVQINEGMEGDGGAELTTDFGFPENAGNANNRLIIETGKTLAADGNRGNWNEQDRSAWLMSAVKAMNPYRSAADVEFHVGACTAINTASRAREGWAMKLFADSCKMMQRPFGRRPGGGGGGFFGRG